MAIMTSSEVKVLLGITDSTKDAFIAAMLPIVQREILEYCKTNFAKAYSWPSGLSYDGLTSVSFTASTKTVTESGGDVIVPTGANVNISGSLYNDGNYTVATGGTGSFIVTESLIDEAEGAAVTIKLVQYPEALKMIVADMIVYKISTMWRGVGATSINIPGGFSSSYSEDGGAYPQSVYNALNKYRVAGVY